MKVSNKLIKHYKSFVGRDFKAVAQCALFVFKNYFSNAEKCVWLALSKVLICVPRILIGGSFAGIQNFVL